MIRVSPTLVMTTPMTTRGVVVPLLLGRVFHRLGRLGELLVVLDVPHTMTPVTVDAGAVRPALARHSGHSLSAGRSKSGTGRDWASSAVSASPFSAMSSISHSISRISRRCASLISTAS